MPRTTLDLDNDTFTRLKKYCQLKHLTFKEATNNLLAQALTASQRHGKGKKMDLPSFPLGIRVDPADREALFNAMGERL